MFLPGGLLVRLASIAASAAIGTREVQEHQGRQAAFESGLLSEEPSALWLLASLGLTALEGRQFIRAAGKAWKQTERALASLDPQAVDAVAALWRRPEHAKLLTPAQRDTLEALLARDAAYKRALKRYGEAASRVSSAGGGATELVLALPDLAVQAVRRGSAYQDFVKHLKEAGLFQRLAPADAVRLRGVFIKARADLGHALTLGEAKLLPPPHRGLIRVREAQPVAQTAAKRAARDFEHGTTGAASDVASREAAVPALRYDNPNPDGANFVKFDGMENGKLLIDAKTRLLTIPTKQGTVVPTSVREQLRRMREALDQNPGYEAVIEFPSAAARDEAERIMRRLGIENIGARARGPR